MADRYECAVYDDETNALTLAIIAVCQDAQAIPDRRVRSCIIASAMMTAAQVLDGNKMPEETNIVKPDGITATMQFVLAPKQPG